MSIECFQSIVHALAHQDSVVLATVIAVSGSVPREVGAKMVIDATGRIAGTIGGGAGEAKAIVQAMVVLTTGGSQRVDIDLTGASYRETEGICGGHMQVWLERWQGEPARTMAQQLLDHLQAGQSVTLVTPLIPDRTPYLATSAAQRLSLTDSAFVETLQPLPTLLIVGAGHVGLQLAKVAALIGFQVVIQDDRPEWGNPQLYPQAALIGNQSIATILDRLNPSSPLYVALVTRGYHHDIAALNVLLDHTPSCHYIGMIGSTRRVRQVFQAIEAQGVAIAQLASIYAPIGLDIGALTPEEIAISIAAELILIRRGGTGQPLSQARPVAPLTRSSQSSFP